MAKKGRQALSGPWPVAVSSRGLCSMKAAAAGMPVSVVIRTAIWSAMAAGARDLNDPCAASNIRPAPLSRASLTVSACIAGRPPSGASTRQPTAPAARSRAGICDPVNQPPAMNSGKTRPGAPAASASSRPASASVAARMSQPGRCPATRSASRSSAAAAGSGSEGWPWATISARMAPPRRPGIAGTERRDAAASPRSSRPSPARKGRIRGNGGGSPRRRPAPAPGWPRARSGCRPAG